MTEPERDHATRFTSAGTAAATTAAMVAFAANSVLCRLALGHAISLLPEVQDVSTNLESRSPRVDLIIDRDKAWDSQLPTLDANGEFLVTGVPGGETIGVDVSVPLSCAFRRMRCTASMTSVCCARNALPRSVVH